jgi:hypothetical protein
MRKVLMVICLLSTSSMAWAQTAPSLGSAATFAVLGSAVTCTGPGVISGDVGATGAFTNTPVCTIAGGAPPATNAAAILAQAALTNAYNAINPINPTNCGTTISTAAFTDAALGPLAPGVYCFPAGVAFTRTTLTLDGSTNPNGIWIFEVGAALAGTNFQVVLLNGAQACNVFWSVGAAVTLTSSSTTMPLIFQGNILAGAIGGAITITGGNLIGRVLANGAVTLTGPNVNGLCAVVDQAKASCKNDDDDDRDKDHHDRDDDRDKDHHHHDKDRDHQDNDHKD